MKPILKKLALRVADLVPRYVVGVGIDRTITYKKETVNGTIAAGGAATGQRIRRSTFSLKVSKDTFASGEKISHQQDQDFRHGFKKTSGGLSGELSPGTYCDWTDSLVRRIRTTVAAIAGLTLTVAVSGAEYTITATGGPNFLTSGLKKGMVVRITAGAFNALNLNKNIVIRLVTGTVITGKALNGSALFAEGPIATATMSIPGKISYMPNTGFTNEAYTIEDLHPNLAVVASERHVGVQMNSLKVSVPGSGICTVDWDMLGLDLQTGAAAYFSSPTVETTTGLTASNSAIYLVNDAYNPDITSLDFTAQANISSAAVGGQNIAPGIFRDKLQAMGNASVFFEDTTLRDAFIAETESGISVIVAVSNDPVADFVSYMFPRVKFNDAGKDDPNTGITQSIPWKALYNFAGGAGVATEKTTMMYQDSAAT